MRRIRKFRIKRKFKLVNKRMNKPYFLKVIYFLLAVISFLVIGLFSAYFYVDYKIYSIATSNNIVEYESKYSKLFLRKRTVDYLIKNDRVLQIDYKNIILSFEADNITKKMEFKLSINITDIIDFEELSGIEHIYIDEFNYDNIFISINDYDFLNDKNILDVYIVTKDNDLEYYQTININDELINIEYSENASGYIIVYVPIISFEIEKTLYDVGDKDELNVIINPSNSTDKTYRFEYDSDYIKINGYSLEALKHGVTTLSIINDENNIISNINFTINNYIKDIIITRSSLTLYEGDTTSLSYEAIPSDAENIDDIEISIEDEKVVTYENGKLKAIGLGTTTVTITTTSEKLIEKEISVTVKEVVSVPTVSGITYISGILIVNKTYSLPSTYAPGLSSLLSSAFSTMKSAAAKEGLSLVITSGYRSYSIQTTLYNNYVIRDGKERADTYSARPGHSEHQSGLAIDVANYTSEWDWLEVNAHKYGFIIRYPEGKESLTGYMYEPWHLRYLGVDVATKIYNSGLCLEEYLNITSVYAS